MGVAYLGERFDGGVPLEENWIGRAGSEAFGGLVHYRDDYQPGAVRYDVGERSNPVLLPMLAEALDVLLAWTPEAVQAYAAPLAAQITAGAAALGFWSEAPAHRAAHLFGLRAPAGLPLDAVQAALDARRVSVSTRGTAIRVSPSVYNDAADAEALLDALAAAAA
jgi:selenocysteine lyase/cysteine desulfurase